MRRLLTGLGATVLLAGAGLLGATPAAATALPMDQCTTSSGAIVAVDFGHWGGPIVRGCGSTPTTGWQLLSQGGWQVTGTTRYPQTFVCRISYSGYQGGTGYPTPAEDPCVNTPKTTAYWSYWHANVGDSGWSYSQDGAARYSPKPGSVDLWTFGSGGSPGVSPDALRAHNSSPGGSSPAPAPHSSAPGGGSGGGGSGSGGSGSGGGSGPGSSGGSGSGSGSAGAGSSGLAGATIGSLSPLRPAGSAKSKTAVKPSRPAAASSTAASSTQASSNPSSSSSIVNADPAAAPRHHSSGSWVPGLITVVLVLGSTAVALGWRRRHS